MERRYSMADHHRAGLVVDVLKASCASAGSPGCSHRTTSFTASSAASPNDPGRSCCSVSSILRRDIVENHQEELFYL
jgi:hypothetical protein